MSTATMSPLKRKTHTKRHPLSTGIASANCRVKTSGTSPDAKAAIPKSNFELYTPIKAALIQINNLKDDVSWEEIFYYLELRKELEESALEANLGLGFTQEEMDAEFDARWKQKQFAE